MNTGAIEILPNHSFQINQNDTKLSFEANQRYDEWNPTNALCRHLTTLIDFGGVVNYLRLVPGSLCVRVLVKCNSLQFWEFVYFP